MLEKRLFRYDFDQEEDELRGPPKGWESKVPLTDEENVAMLQELSECYAQLGMGCGVCVCARARVYVCIYIYIYI